MNTSSYKLLAALILVAVPGLALADQVTGVVVDSNGFPVPNVNITAESVSGGGDGNLANGGTGANGVFNVTINPGTYEFTFEPPAPPAAVALVTVVDNVFVSGVTNLGTVALGEAVVLSGRVVRAGNVPVAGVNLDVIDVASGDNIDLPGDQTNTQGQFTIAVPLGQIELRFDTTPVFTPLLAPEELALTMSADTNIGDVLLEPGFKVTAAVFNSAFQAIVDLDVDVRDVATGVKLYTPGDNTDNNGFVDFVVPQGVFDIEFCPQFALGLVAEVQPSLAISSTTNLGVVTLSPGVPLTGTVTSHLGPVVPGVDLDVLNSTTQLSVFVCNDNTNAAGHYQVNVPVGQFDLIFTPTYAEPLASKTESSVIVNGPTLRNAILPFCDCGSPSGAGAPGTGGLVPQISATGGSLRLGNPSWGFDVTNARGGASGLATLHYGPVPGISHGAFGNISLMAGRALVVPFQLDGTPGLAGAGSASFHFPVPELFPSYGSVLSASAIVFDPAGANGRALTPLLSGALCQ